MSRKFLMRSKRDGTPVIFDVSDPDNVLKLGDDGVFFSIPAKYSDIVFDVDIRSVSETDVLSFIKDNFNNSSKSAENL